MNKLNSFGVPRVTEVDDNQSTIVQQVCLGNVDLPFEQAEAAGLVGTRTLFVRAQLKLGAELSGTRIAWKESLTQGKPIVVDAFISETRPEGGKIAKYTEKGALIYGRMVLVHEQENDQRLAGVMSDYNAEEVAMVEDVAGATA